MQLTELAAVCLCAWLLVQLQLVTYALYLLMRVTVTLLGTTCTWCRFGSDDNEQLARFFNRRSGMERLEARVSVGIITPSQASKWSCRNTPMVFMGSVHMQ